MSIFKLLTDSHKAFSLIAHYGWLNRSYFSLDYIYCCGFNMSLGELFLLTSTLWLANHQCIPQSPTSGAAHSWGPPALPESIRAHVCNCVRNRLLKNAMKCLNASLFMLRDMHCLFLCVSAFYPYLKMLLRFLVAIIFYLILLNSYFIMI